MIAKRTMNSLLYWLNSHLCRYLIVGGSNTLLSLALYYVMLKLGVNYLLANTICFIIGFVVSYSLNTLIVLTQHGDY
ncbi:MAG: GtrA-like protein [Pseudomonadota bacterium]